MKESNLLSQLQTTQLSQILLSNSMSRFDKDNVLQRFLNIDIKCSKGNQVSHLCSNKNCMKVGILCNNLECQCYQQHQNCSIQFFKSTIKHLSSKIFKFQSFQKIIDTHIQKAIEELSDFREKLVCQFNKECQLIGLSKNQKQFLSYLQKGQKNKITGKITFNLHLDQIVNQRTKIKADKFQNRFKEDFNKLQKRIKQFQNETYTYQKYTIYSILQNVQLNWDSKILKSIQQSCKLQLFFQKYIKQVKLLFRASQYKFQSQRFHQKCNGKTNTICLIQTEFGKIIGGYTPLPWHSNNAWSVDDKYQSFIFSLTNNHKFKLTKKQYTILGNSSYGPIFGGGHDIVIHNKSNQNNSSYANICYSYHHQEYKYNDKSSWQKYSGGKQNNNFKTKQYQVFEIIFM